MLVLGLRHAFHAAHLRWVLIAHPSGPPSTSELFGQDIATIDCVVGRVKVGDRWGTIDRGFGSECAVMHGMWESEYESEDEND